MSSNIDHPEHYGGDSTYETIKVIDAWELGFSLGNAVKYISRAGKKEGATKEEDLRKAVWYLQHEIGEDKPISDVPVKMQKYRDACIAIIDILNSNRTASSMTSWDEVNAIRNKLRDEGLME